MRKSPIKHHVRSYIKKKKDTHVHDYDRGHGKHPEKLIKPTLSQKKKQSSSTYRIEIIYNNSSIERFTVTAKSYPQAIENAMLTKSSLSFPKIVEASKSN